MRMVMDQVFGNIGELRMYQEPVLDFLEKSKDLLPEISMDLDDFHFDFDNISDSLGPWIQPNDLKLDTENFDDDNSLKSEPIDFEDLDITEAVRYDCMWSTSISPKTADSTIPASQLPPPQNQHLQHPLCENTLFEEFLKIIDTPTPADLDIDIKPEPVDIKVEIKPDPDTAKSLSDVQSQVRMFTSLDHCYVSTSSLPGNYNHENSANFIDTPPESSEDDEDSSCSTSSSSGYRSFAHVVNKRIHNQCRSQSLLKKPKSTGDAKFCFRVKLKADKARSVLKQSVNCKTGQPTLKISSIGYKNSSSSSSSSSCSSSNSSPTTTTTTTTTSLQASIRRRKEASLKQKHHEAREIHNQMERQRRNELKVAFEDLKANLPEIAGSDKVSKQMILDKAVESCRVLKSREISLKVRKDKLRRTNNLLREKLKRLQSERRAVDRR